VGMIRRTFQILPKVGPGTERTLWREGVLDWDAFRDAPTVPGMRAGRKSEADRLLDEADALLESNRLRELSSLLPRQEHWRLYPAARHGMACLDIETNGLSHDSTVTVVGVHGPQGTYTLVKDDGLCMESLQESLQGATLLVTFNGSCFDVPVLRHSFPGLDLNIPHLDLRFACRRIGYSGGLKKIETSLGLKRDESLTDVDGMEAVRLWHRWRRMGDRSALQTLMDYNRADTVNLAELADLVYPRLEHRCTEC